MYANFHLSGDDLFADHSPVTLIDLTGETELTKHPRCQATTIADGLPTTNIEADSVVAACPSRKRSKPMLLFTESMFASILRANYRQINQSLAHSDQAFDTRLQTYITKNNVRRRPSKLLSAAILFYQIRSLELIRSLWINYRRSGLGDLPPRTDLHTVHREFWPNEILLVIEEAGRSLFGEERQEPLALPLSPRSKAHTYLALVDGLLQTIGSKQKRLAAVFAEEIALLGDDCRRLEDEIKTFVAHELACFQIEIDCQIEQVHYDYQDELFRRYYRAQVDHEQQRTKIPLITRLCELHEQNERLASEIRLLRDTLFPHLSRHRFHLDDIFRCPLLLAVRNPNLRQQLHQHIALVQEKIASHTFHDYLRDLEKQYQGQQNASNAVAHNIWHMSKRLPATPKFIFMVREKIDQHLQIITARVQCIRQHETRLFHFYTSADMV